MEKSQDIRPGVDLHKKTTRVNLSIVIGVVVFFVLTAFVIWAVNRDPPASTEEMQAK